MAEKRKYVSVDEKKLQHIIAGVPYPETSEKTETEHPLVNDPPTEPDQVETYVATYMKRIVIRDRKHTSICLTGEVIKKLKYLVEYSEAGLTMSGLINNILIHHIEQHKEAINEIYDRKK